MADMTRASILPKPGVSPKAAQVLNAAKTVFLRDGYGATSMDAVAREAGVSKATLYAHFTSKDNLFAAVVAGECQRHIGMLEQIEAERLPIKDALLRVAAWFTGFLLRPEVLAVHRLVVSEAHRFPELGRAFYEAGPTWVQRMLAEFLGRAAARGELNIPDPEIAAELFLSMCKGHLHLRSELGYAPPGQAELDRVVHGAVDLFVAGYRPA
jgi:TetR/AcrR family transcriptional repressor of mexJK operon